MLTHLTVTDVLGYVADTLHCDADSAREQVRISRLRPVLDMSRTASAETGPGALFSCAAALMAECLRRAPFAAANTQMAFGLMRSLLALNDHIVEADQAAQAELVTALASRAPRATIYAWFDRHTRRIGVGTGIVDDADSVADLTGVGVFVGHARSLVKEKVSRELAWVRDAVAAVTARRSMMLLKPGLDCANIDDSGRSGLLRHDWAGLLKRNWCEFGQADVLILSADAVTVSVGWEFGWAVAARVPVLFLIDEQVRDRLHERSAPVDGRSLDITALPAGHTGKLAESAPNVYSLIYSSPQDLKVKLDAFFDEHAHMLVASRDDRQARTFGHTGVYERLQHSWYSLNMPARERIAAAMRSTVEHLSLVILEPASVALSSYDTVVTLAAHLNVNLDERPASRLTADDVDALRRAAELEHWSGDLVLELEHLMLTSTAVPALRRLNYSTVEAWQVLHDTSRDGAL